ncbi:phosphotransferase [Qipengyuania sp. XHP0207]|uniref:phosphotransferase n=1 Tax=Qipengyuania sp. XHP0207 TaxID=3038078 RepID=UPI00241E8119|nr:phosphotransferase [Qipengyuania sp. XHP0207]MDG5749427.1 phosphotransferase [Qipengyuania sp. XHP0207]
MADFPVHPDEVTAQWLGEVLGMRIDSVRWEAIGTGQVGDSVRFFIAGEGEPFTMAGKFSAADEASRATATTFGLYRKEVEFYRHAAPHLAVRVPRVHFADVTADGSEFAMLFEDLGPAEQGDQIAGTSLERAQEAIRQAAAIHALSWGRADILEAEWIQPADDLGATVATLYPQAQAVFRDRYADTLPADHMALCDELSELAPIYFHREPDIQCVVHGDFRLDNMLFDIRGGAEPIAILDWQTVAAGKAMTDIGYLMGCGLGETMWRRHEEELLDLWLSQMAQRGVALSRREIHEDYRRGILHGVSTAVFSAAFVKRTERGDANFLSMARGACSLAIAHDSLAALKETI